MQAAQRIIIGCFVVAMLIIAAYGAYIVMFNVLSPIFGRGLGEYVSEFIILETERTLPSEFLEGIKIVITAIPILLLSSCFKSPKTFNVLGVFMLIILVTVIIISIYPAYQFSNIDRALEGYNYIIGNDKKMADLLSNTFRWCLQTSLLYALALLGFKRIGGDGSDGITPGDR